MQLREELLMAIEAAADHLQALESENGAANHDPSAKQMEAVQETTKLGSPGEGVQQGASALIPQEASNARMTKRNPGIHPRNVYATEEPNFAALAAKDPKLKPFVSLDDNQRGYIDFTDSDACRSVSLQQNQVRLTPKAHLGHSSIFRRKPPQLSRFAWYSIS